MSDSSNDNQAPTIIHHGSGEGCLGWMALGVVVLGLLALYLYGSEQAERREKTVSRFEVVHTNGFLLDTLKVTNQSTEMSDVHVVLTFYMENGRTATVERRWASWSVDETKEVTYSSQYSRLQKVEMEGEFDTGWISGSWLWN